MLGDFLTVVIVSVVLWIEGRLTVTHVRRFLKAVWPTFLRGK